MYSTTARLATLISFLLPLTSATFSFNGTWGPIDATISPSLGLSDACVKTYAMSIDCAEDFMYGVRSDNQTQSGLEKRCTDNCINGLRKWRDALRSSCTAGDIQKVNATVYNSNDENSSSGPGIIAGVAIQGAAGAEYMYWLDCMKDLNSGGFCVFSSDITDKSKTLPADTTDPAYNTANIPAFCNSSCLTQDSAFVYKIGSTVGDSTDSIADVRKICPNVDINNFPLVKSLQPFDSSTTSSTTSSSSSTPSGNRSSTTSGNRSTTSATAAPNAAGSLKAASLLGSTFLVGVIVSLGIL